MTNNLTVVSSSVSVEDIELVPCETLNVYIAKDTGRSGDIAQYTVLAECPQSGANYYVPFRDPASLVSTEPCAIWKGGTVASASVIAGNVLGEAIVWGVVNENLVVWDAPATCEASGSLYMQYSGSASPALSTDYSKGSGRLALRRNGIRLQTSKKLDR